MSLRYRSVSELPVAMQAQVKPLLGEQKSIGDAVPPLLSAEAQRPRKYGNTPTVVDGLRFDSKLEARCYEWLKLRQAAGEVRWFIRQVTFVLEGGVRYRADYLAVTDAGVEVIDAKGVLTQASANKIKQMKDRYGIEVVLWKGGL